MRSLPARRSRPPCASTRAAWLVVAWLAAGAPAHAGGAAGLGSLRYFVGTWRCAGQFADGRPIRSRERFALALDGHWLRMRHQDDAPDRYAASAWWGIDRPARRFAVTIFDNSGGTRRYTSSGWKGAKLILENTARAGHVDRFAYRRRDEAHYVVSYAHRDGTGAWRPGDELTCTREARP